MHRRVRRIVVPRGVAEKLVAKHQVQPAEVVEVFRNADSPPRIWYHERGHRPAENVYRALGRTDSGRCLWVLFVLKRDATALVITAMDMSERERRTYGRRS